MLFAHVTELIEAHAPRGSALGTKVLKDELDNKLVRETRVLLCLVGADRRLAEGKVVT